MKITCSMSNNRVLYIDLAKSIAIYLVILGHTLSSLASPEVLHSSIREVLSRAIYAFHMPLFMFLSGLFASSSVQKPLRMMLIQKAKQLLWPCITFGCILSFFWYKWNINLDSLRHGVLWYGLFYDYWFLHSLFANYCIAWFIYRSPRKLRIWIFLLTMGIIWFLVSKGHNLNNMSTMTPFFFAGIVGRTIFSHIISHMKICFWVCIIIFLALFPLYQSAYNSSMYFFNPFTTTKILEYLYRLLMGGLGTIGIIAFCRVLEHNFHYHKTISLLSKIGQSTLYIYIIQGLLLECILAHYFKLYINEWGFTMLVSPILSMVVLAICYKLSSLIKRIRCLDIVLFGNFKLKIK